MHRKPIVVSTMLSVAFALCASTAYCAAPPSDRAGVSASPQTAPPTHRWPLELQSGQDQITLYQPQLETFKGDQLTARAAVSIQKGGQAEPTFGALWLQSRVATDRVARTVRILDVNVTRARFPDDVDRETELTAALRAHLAGHSATLSLDQLLAMLALVEKENEADEALLMQPPHIVFRGHSAVLVQYDGQPRLSPAGVGKLLRAVNTPFLVVLDPTGERYYLKGGGQWFQSSDALGPFEAAREVPADVQTLAEKSGYRDPDEDKAADAGLEIVTATEPTELIWTDGPPELGSVAGTNLLYVTNTDADVFLDIRTQDLYVLLSGRWFTARTRTGPWTYLAPDKLPADFKRIPPGSEKGDVLAHVAGTEAAQDALLDSYVPQTAAVDRKKVQPPHVEYDGAPDFEPVEGVTITYAVNTPSAVLEVGGQYYCCENAVWYVAPRPTGPWELCAAVPQIIYTLPPSCPLYHVRFVYVYGHDDHFVYCGYTPGYVGCYVHAGVVVYGTGYAYHPWVGAAYYPRPCTFGFCAHYNSYTGNWGFTVGAHGSNGWVAVHGGSHGWIAGGGGWWGAGGYRHVNFDRNINVSHTELNVARGSTTHFDANLYNRRGDVHHDFGRAPVDDRQPPHAGGAFPADRDATARRPNDVFADRDGGVHRRTLDGWETRDNGRWTPQDRGAAPPAGGEAHQRPQLDGDAHARAAGAQRPQVYQRPSAGGRSFGGMRGGGRHR